MAGNKIRIGPWKLGLNLRLNEDLINEGHLRECLNFDVADEGTLIPRRALRYFAKPNDVAKVLGAVPITSDLTSLYAVAMSGTTIYYTNNISGWTTAAYTLANAMAKVVPYNNKIYFVPVGDQTFTGGFSAVDFTGAATAIPTMPAGKNAFMFKDRLFIINDTRIFYSKVTDPSNWTIPDGGFFDVTPGDGDVITSVVVQNNTLIIFKRNSTYVFTYSTDPGVDGFLRTISADIGAYATAVFNNEVYTVNDRSVFKFINQYYQDIGQVLNLKYTSTGTSTNTRLHLIDQTLIVTLAGGNAFALNLINGAWSQYKYDFDFVDVERSNQFGSATQRWTLFSTGYVIDHIRNDARTLDTGLVGGILKTIRPIYRFMTKSFVEFQQGRFIIGDEDQWKRLHWWAVNGFDPLSSGTPILVINKNPQIFMDNVVPGRVSSTSARFRRIAVGYESPTAQVVLALTTPVGPWFKDIIMYASAKATISD